ncbi:MAG: potassium transporter TrkG [Eubacteriales bacterium]
MRIPKKFSPAQSILLAFLAVIVIGGILLTLPISSETKTFTNPADAFFTATSATCVTGLVTLDTGTYWSSFGKAVILLLIQVGGMGVMTISFIVSVILKRRVTPKERVVFAKSMNLSNYSKVMRFFMDMMAFMLIFETAGALLLAIRFIPRYGVAEGISKSVFHSVSAFCNAGFDILGGGTSLIPYSNDAFVCLVICALIISGGLGFVVWQNLYKKAKYGERLSAYTKLVLVATLTLLVSGAVIFISAEWGNPATLGGSGFGQKLLSGFFQSVTFRTAGFNTLSITSLTGASKAFAMILMFIGGSSASTAGGIKTVTFALVIIGALNFSRGKKEVNIFGRRVEHASLLHAYAVAGIAITAIILSSFLLAFTQSGTYSGLLFESFSAFGTVGVTDGVTATLNVFGKILIMLLMYMGRVGALTITYSVLTGFHKEKQTIKYPKTNFLIG